MDDDLVGPARPKKRKIEDVQQENETAENEEGPPKPKELEEPKKKRVKKGAFNELTHDLPNKPLYEWSFSHCEQLSHIILTPITDFVISVSLDGYVKFWKRTFETIEFVKLFRPSKTPVVSCCTTSWDGKYFFLVSKTGGVYSVKVYDVVNVVLTNVIELAFIPLCICAVRSGDKLADLRIVVSEYHSNKLHIFDPFGAGHSSESVVCEKFHRRSFVTLLEYNPTYSVLVSCDSRGIMEYIHTGNFSAFTGVTFVRKIQTDLFDVCKAKAQVVSVVFNSKGGKMSVYGSDDMIRVFDFLSGKLLLKIAEGVERMKVVQLSSDERYQLNGLDFGKRVEIEKQIVKVRARYLADGDLSLDEKLKWRVPCSNAVFSRSGEYLLYSTALGIKIVNLVTAKVSRLLGKHEHNFRFLSLCLVQGKVSVDRNKLAGMERFQRKYSVIVDSTEATNYDLNNDPMIFCLAYKKNRFFLFSTRLFDEFYLKEGLTRDIVNESDYDMNKLEEIQIKKKARKVLPNEAVIHTEFGDIKLKLFPEVVPLTVENFVVHSRNGYYNNCIFHRIIKNFMIQTGDPTGDGTGGTSIWGGSFSDEFSPKLRHNKPFMVSMANTGQRNMNGSQFFITTIETPWLDDKHTLFGEVVEGSEVVRKIESVKCSRYDKPYEDIKIISISVQEIKSVQ